MDDIREAVASFQRRKIGAAVIDLNAAVLTKLKAEKLNGAAVFLARCLTKEGREAVAEKTGIGYETVLRLTRYCDLMRLPGISRRLLKAFCDTGYDSVAKIRAANPAAMQNCLQAYLFTRWGKAALPSNFNVKRVVALAERLPDLLLDDAPAEQKTAVWGFSGV